MKILTISAMIALPFMALGQTTEPQQQQQQQEQTKQGPATETQPMPPTKGKKETPAPEPVKTKAKPETATAHEQTDVQRNEGRPQDVNKNQQPGAHSSTSQTKGKVNVEEFRARHREVFTLGRHPKEFFVQRFGPTHFRMIGETYFVFVDSCWVAVEVDGFGYSERVICAGDPEYIEID